MNKLAISIIILTLAFGFLNTPLAKNTLGHLRGFGDCMHCGGTWDWKEGHTIMYSESGGMFPLCEECYKKLSIEEVEHYIKELVDWWIELFPDYPRYQENKEAIIEGAIKTVKEEKANK